MVSWSLDALDLEDPLNEEIWQHSPEEQERIQPYRDGWAIGEIGAQQAMRYPYRLPWVPDIVGRDWKSRDAVVIFGSAYGPLVGREGRPSFIAPHKYVRASNAAEFTKLYSEKVLQDRYYRRIAELGSTVVPVYRMIILDLGRVSFVRCSLDRDEGGDSVIGSTPELFTRHVQSPAANEWLWRRVLGTEAETVIALGKVAEHGILRLFSRNLRDVSIRDSSDASIRFVAKLEDHRWPLRNAHHSRTLKDRAAAASPPYWAVEGMTSEGILRAWRVAVVPHPTEARGDRSALVNYSVTSLRAAYQESTAS